MDSDRKVIGCSGPWARRLAVNAAMTCLAIVFLQGCANESDDAVRPEARAFAEPARDISQSPQLEGSAVGDGAERSIVLIDADGAVVDAVVSRVLKDDCVEVEGFADQLLGYRYSLASGEMAPCYEAARTFSDSACTVPIDGSDAVVIDRQGRAWLDSGERIEASVFKLNGQICTSQLPAGTTERVDRYVPIDDTLATALAPGAPLRVKVSR